MKQLTLPLQELCKYPYWCPHEMECIDLSDKGNLKSCCDLTIPTVGHPTWTNCRTWGRCTMRGDVFGHHTPEVTPDETPSAARLDTDESSL